MIRKRNTLVVLETGLTDIPADKDIVIDGDFADMQMIISNFTGTTQSIAFSLVELVYPRLTLPYDGQTSNFTLGKKVKGKWSNAMGVIVADTDGGASGTLTLAQVSGKFIDNEPIVDDNGTPGSATVNSATGGTSLYTEGDEYAASGTISVDGRTRVEVVTPLSGSPATGHMHPILPRLFRMKFTKGGTYTNLDLAIELNQYIHAG